ncbi:unnamed protein product [Sphagnum jensenii]|uniref:Phosphopantetheine adenylyltransferase n=1 Tax=Sphagnum jensenii TaxID=128206 RepID=A0ABP0V6W3_9BRYO
MVIHFTMDRIKASPNMLGRYKALSANEYVGVASLATQAGSSSPELAMAGKSAVQKLQSNVYFWWSLGLDQMVHHLTDLIIVFFLISFNPWHEGHEDVLNQVLKAFDKVVIMRAVNPEKEKSGDMEFPQHLLVGGRIEIVEFTGLLRDFVAGAGYAAIVKGIRNQEDFEYERMQLYFNEDLGVDTPTFFVIANRNCVHKSSTFVRALRKFQNVKKLNEILQDNGFYPHIQGWSWHGCPGPYSDNANVDFAIDMKVYCEITRATTEECIRSESDYVRQCKSWIARKNDAGLIKLDF